MIYTFVELRNYAIIFNTLSEEFEKAKIFRGKTPRIPIFATH